MSTASETSNLSGHTSRRMAFPRSHIEVSLDHHFNSKVYTTGSTLSGKLTIVTQRDVRFDSVQIVLVGMSRTRVDGMGSPAESSHVFLKLAMPIPESTYPVPRVLENGRTYTVPFNFVIPEYLTIGACNHHVTSDLVHDQHVRLPPTMGFWEKDDMSPDMAKVEYSIRARVFREPDLEGPLIKVMETTQQIRVLPASPEDAPLGITKHDKEYRMSKTKTLRKNLLAGKLGKVTAVAVQPEAVSLRPDGHGVSSTTAQVQLSFEPAAPGVAPPSVTSVSAKVAAHTYFAAGGIPILPNLGDWNKSFAVDKRGSYSTTVSLFSQAVDTFTWKSHINSQARRDSGYASEEPDSDHSASDPRTQRRRGSRHMRTPKQRSSSDAAILHTATLQVPIKLPLHKKTFVPTFHSCIVSRVYVLHLGLTLGSGSASSTLSLHIPLQVAVEMDGQGLGGMEGLPSFEAAVQEAEVDEYLRPRMMNVPDAQYRERGMEGLPGYGELLSGRQRSRVSAW